MISKSLFGITPEGKQVDLYRIVNFTGAELAVITFGGIIQSIKMTDKDGALENVVLGFDSLEGYVNDSNYIGALAGRYAGRIAKGKFSLESSQYQLSQNEKGDHLHGGFKGFNKVVWKGEIVSDNAIRLLYESEDGEEGYPGNLNTEVIYSLSDNNEIHVEVLASTDRDTIANVVQHSYFNLSGKRQSILDHMLQIRAAFYLPVNKELIPLGLKSSVENTPFDFNYPMLVGSRIPSQDEQLQRGNGYDHSWIANHPNDGIKEVATLHDPTSGRTMKVLTDLPILHLYSGNFLSGKFHQFQGLCLETQHFPDAPNQINFPRLVVTPAKPYSSTTIFQFLN